MKNCAICFDHELNSDTLKCSKKNNLSDLNFASRNTLSSSIYDHINHEDSIINGTTKVISIQTLSCNKNSALFLHFKSNRNFISIK